MSEKNGGKKRCTAILLAAGTGSRMKSNVAKQYMSLGNRPLIWHALHAVEESSVIDDCILVTGAEDIVYVQKEIVERYGFKKVDTIVGGGRERCDSVYSALKVMAAQDMRIPNTDGYVFIHDGARPFLTEEILERCYDAVQKYDACVTGMPVKDTIKIADRDGFAVNTPDRNFVWQIQTPQVFHTPLIIEAYSRLMKERKSPGAGEGGHVDAKTLNDVSQGSESFRRLTVTDDAMVVETFMGCPVKLVRGTYENIKITTPEDLVAAEAFLAAKES